MEDGIRIHNVEVGIVTEDQEYVLKIFPNATSFRITIFSDMGQTDGERYYIGIIDGKDILDILSFAEKDAETAWTNARNKVYADMLRKLES